MDIRNKLSFVRHLLFNSTYESKAQQQRKKHLNKLNQLKQFQQMNGDGIPNPTFAFCFLFIFLSRTMSNYSAIKSYFFRNIFEQYLKKLCICLECYINFYSYVASPCSLCLVPQKKTIENY